MKVYLVRHGETIGNKEGFHQTSDTPLTEYGINQAKKVAKRLKNLGIDFIYTSTHDRAQKTASIIARQLRIPIEPWGSLTELRRPKEIRGRKADDLETKRIESLTIENFGNKNWKFSDEENFFDLVKRADLVLDHLSKNHSDQTVLCVSHGTFIKVLVSRAVFGEKLTPELMQMLRIGLRVENTGVSLLRTYDFGWGLVSWNDTSHL